MDELPPRRRLHHGIRREFARAIARYYRLHPEKLDDPDREEGTNALLKMLEDVLKVVDLFEIGDMPERRKLDKPLDE